MGYFIIRARLNKENIVPLKIVWNEAFSVGSQLLDQQHQQLFALLQKAADCIKDESPNNRGAFHSILNEVCLYTSTHFRTEEALLKQCEYPDLEAHKAEHFVFLAQISELNFAASQGVVRKVDLHDTLFRWLSHHILESDMLYSAYLKKTNKR